MLDIFEILGPIMVGPSSSHTAGAVRIGRMARTLLGEPPVKADIGLYGSFAETGRGHGTDRALVAGLLGMKPDDLRIPESFSVAKEQGLSFVFHPAELRQAHPNTAVLTVEADTPAVFAIPARLFLFAFNHAARSMRGAAMLPVSRMPGSDKFL